MVRCPSKVMEQVNDVPLTEVSDKVRWWIELARINPTEPSSA
jgi:hypothetical protein